MTSKLARDVTRRPTLVTYGTDHQPRFLPVLESGVEETPDAMDAASQPNDTADAESSEDKESLVNSDDYDTDLDGEGQSHVTSVRTQHRPTQRGV